MALFNKKTEDEQRIKEAKKHVNHMMGSKLLKNGAFTLKIQKNVGTNPIKQQTVWNNIYKDIIHEIDTKNLSKDEVDARLDELLEKYADSDVKKQRSYNIEEKFNIDLSGKYFFECDMEEVRDPISDRKMYNACVIVCDDSLHVFKESIFTKGKISNIKIPFNDIGDISYDKKDINGDNLELKMKNNEDIYLRNITKKDASFIIEQYNNSH